MIHGITRYNWRMKRLTWAIMVSTLNRDSLDTKEAKHKGWAQMFHNSVDGKGCRGSCINIQNTSVNAMPAVTAYPEAVICT